MFCICTALLLYAVEFRILFRLLSATCPHHSDRYGQMCPGMIRDQHSAEMVALAEQNNRTLRSRAEGITGEVCIYQVSYSDASVSYRSTI